MIVSPSRLALRPTRSWVEHVFHVLAHARGNAHLPSSVFDATYVRHVAEHAGPAGERTLADDAAMLGRIDNHDALSRLQLVALLFDSVAEADRAASVDLAKLPVDSGILRALAPLTGPAELLRCAALLEQSAVDKLPPPTGESDTLRRALDKVAAASPTIPNYDLMPVRSLRLRGRLMRGEIWHGAPCTALDLSATHVAWQVAHEAVVGEVSHAAAATKERTIEHVALVLMAERASEAGLEDEHAAWLSHFGEIPAPRRSALEATDRELVARLRSSDAGA